MDSLSFRSRAKSLLHNTCMQLFGSPSRFFLSLALLVGVFFVITSPPGFGLDERAHFMRTYLVSNGQFVPERLPPDNQIGAYLPINLVQFVGASTMDLLDNGPPKFFTSRHDANMQSYSIFFNEQFSKEKINDTSTNSQLLAAQAYSSFGYLHMALVTKFTQLVDMPMIYAMYLSRFVNLLVYIMLIFLSIKVIPNYKWLIASVGLLPTAIYQATSMSLDPLVTGLGILATAYALNFWFAKKKSITKKDLIVVLAIFISVALIKTPYAPLMLIFLAVPSDRFKSKIDSYTWKVILLTASLLAAISWVYLNRHITPGLVALQPGHASMPEQISYILNNPINTLKAIVKTHYQGIDHSLASLLGRAGDRQVGLPNAFLYLLFLTSTGLAALMGVGSIQEKLNKKDSKMFNIITALTIIGIITIVSITLYVTFTPVGASIVQGIQGRYFLPIIPITMILIARLLNIRVLNKPKVINTIRVSSALLLVFTALIFFMVNF